MTTEIDSKSPPPPEPQAPALALDPGSAEYIVVEGYCAGDLANKVNDNISEGLMPIGGIAVTSDLDDRGNENRRFFQAMLFLPNAIDEPRPQLARHVRKHGA
jgi:hypothetical protein